MDLDRRKTCAGRADHDSGWREVDRGREDPGAVVLGDLLDGGGAGDVAQLVRLVDAECCCSLAVTRVDDHEPQITTIGRHPVMEREGGGLVGVDVNTRQEGASTLCGYAGRRDEGKDGCGNYADREYAMSFH